MLLGGGEEGGQRIEGDGAAEHAAAQADDVGLVVLAGQRGRRGVVDDGRSHTGDLVGRHGDADTRSAGADAQLGPPRHHGPPDRRAVVGVVNGCLAVDRAQVIDLMAPLGQLGLEHLLEGETGMIRTHGDAHCGQVYRRSRGSFGREPVRSASMALNPRTPVVVGVGQVVVRPEAGSEPADRPEPLDLMVQALRAAAEDCDGVVEGAGARAGAALIRRAQSVRVVVPLGWRSINPAQLVADRLGTEPGQLMVSAMGGTPPQAMMHDACLAIGRGDLDVVLVTGAEAMYPRPLSRRNPSLASLNWVSQSAGDTPEPTMFGVD